jgi:hypothetical protein
MLNVYFFYPPMNDPAFKNHYSLVIIRVSDLRIFYLDNATGEFTNPDGETEKIATGGG